MDEDDPLIVEVDPASVVHTADDSEVAWSDSDDGINADEPERAALETSEDMMRAARATLRSLRGT